MSSTIMYSTLFKAVDKPQKKLWCTSDSLVIDNQIRLIIASKVNLLLFQTILLYYTGFQRVDIVN